MEGPKERVSRRFLELVKGFVPLKDARLATLGGHGIEAVLWSQLGVPPGHGWLIEINRVRGVKLIATHAYRMCNRLSAFHGIVSGHGENVCIDGFHLDLCGTMRDDVIADFSPSLELVLKSKGRCFAVTVADQRGNMVLEKWPQYLRRGREAFGSLPASQTQSALEEQQKRLPVSHDRPAFFSPFDPQKAAKREFGLMTVIAEMLQKYPAWSPSLIERYIYVSRYEPQPFRMRTYLFRFDEHAYDAAALQQKWLVSPLYYFNKEKAFVEIKTKRTPAPAVRPQLEKGKSMTSKLAGIVKALGSPEVDEEYKQLLEGRENHTRYEQLLAGLEDLVKRARSGKLSDPPRTKKKSPKAASEADGQSRGRKRGLKNLSEREQIEWILKAIEMKVRLGDAEYKASWEKLLTDDFGYYDARLGHRIRSAIAHANGKFRPHFIKRIKAAFGEDAQSYIDRLPQP